MISRAKMAPGMGEIFCGSIDIATERNGEGGRNRWCNTEVTLVVGCLSKVDSYQPKWVDDI